jgi:hypothetical protein
VLRALLHLLSQVSFKFRAPSNGPGSGTASGGDSADSAGDAKSSASSSGSGSSGLERKDDAKATEAGKAEAGKAEGKSGPGQEKSKLRDRSVREVVSEDGQARHWECWLRYDLWR